MDKVTVSVNTSQDYANIARANVNSNIYNRVTSSTIKTAVKELSQSVDRFEQTTATEPVGYENFAVYRKVSAHLEKLRTMELPATGVPNAVMIKSTLESLQNEIQSGSETLSADPYILMNLLNNLLEKAG